mgnify:CR=1 FL=1
MGVLDGKVAIITGGASGIGKGMATAVAKAGAGVTIADIQVALVAETAENLRGQGLDVLDVVEALTPDFANRLEANGNAPADVRMLALTELLYGSGLRVHECTTLRVKDIDLSSRVLSIRNSKGSKDRTTLLPEQLFQPLQAHLIRVASLHRDDLAKGAGIVPMPDALDRKYPSAARSLAWQFAFPSAVVRPWGDTKRFVFQGVHMMLDGEPQPPREPS